jgi:hypothetical protein
MLNEEISLAKFNGDFFYNNRQPKDFFRAKRAKERLPLPVDTLLWKCSDFGISSSHAITEWWVMVNTWRRFCGVALVLAHLFSAIAVPDMP